MMRRTSSIWLSTSSCVNRSNGTIKSVHAAAVESVFAKEKKNKKKIHSTELTAEFYLFVQYVLKGQNQHRTRLFSLNRNVTTI